MQKKDCFRLVTKDIFFSCILHVLLLSSIFIVLPGWKKIEPSPVMTVQLINLPAAEIKKHTPKSDKKTVVQKPVKQNRPEKKVHHSVPKKNSVTIKKSQQPVKVLSEKKVISPQLSEKAIMAEQEKQEAIKRDKAFLENIRQIEKKNAQAIPSLKLPQAKNQNNSEEQENIEKDRQQVAYYVALIKQKISNAWQYPPNITKQMTATITVSFTATGELKQLSVEKHSISTDFDQSVLQAVQMAAPFNFFRQIKLHLFEQYFQTLTLTFSPQDLIQ